MVNSGESDSLTHYDIMACQRAVVETLRNTGLLMDTQEVRQRLQQLIERNDPLVKGHPLHAMLTDLPVGMLVASETFDMLDMFTHRPGWSFAADATTGLDALSGGIAAALGLWDYQAVPQDHPARRVGAWHGWSNGGVLALVLLSVGCRRTSHRTAGRVISLAALGLLGVSGWLGGELVFRLGWRVQPAEQEEQLEVALRQRGETSLVEQARATVSEYEQTHTLLP